MRKMFCAAALAVLCLGSSPQSADAQGKFSIGIRSNVGTPPNPNAGYGQPMIWGEAVWINDQQFWGTTAHGSMTLPAPPTPGEGPSAYRVRVKSVYHQASDTYASGFFGALVKEGYWTGAGEIWWSGTFLAAWTGVTPGYNLPYSGTYTVTFSLEVTVPGANWLEVATTTGEFDW